MRSALSLALPENSDMPDTALTRTDPSLAPTKRAAFENAALHLTSID